MSFVVSTSQIDSITEFSTTYALKTNVNEDTSGTPPINTKGRELQPVNISVRYLRAAGVDPRSKMEQWAAQVGQNYPLYIGGRVFGPSKLQLQIVDVAAVSFSNSGDMIKCDLMLSFMEYSPTTYSNAATKSVVKVATSAAVKDTSGYNATPAQRDANIHADTSAYWTTNKSNANPDSSAYWSAQKDKAMQAKASYSDKVEKKASAKKQDANIRSSTSAYWNR